MANSIRILAFSGSARRESLNRKLLAVAVQATRDAGAEVTLLDLNDYAMPLYHGDLEEKEGLPVNAQKLIDLIKEHQGLLVASPEYNSMITPLLKNTVDWCTRGEANPLIGKTAAIVSASPGAFGAIRSLKMAQQLFLHLGCIVAPTQCFVAKAHEAFDEKGALKDGKTQKQVQTLAAQLVKMTKALAP